MTLTLTPDIEQALARQASDRGTTPELLVLDILRRQFGAPRTRHAATSESATSLADYLAGHIGVLHSADQVPGGARMSEDGGKKLAAALAEKRRRGQL